MPEKSIREMNRFERQHYSLAGRTFRTVITGAIVFGLLTLAMGLGLYAYALAGQYISDACAVSKNAVSIMGYVTDAAALSDEIMARYGALAPEQRADTGSDAYRAVFDGITERGDYENVTGVLSLFMKTNGVSNLSLAMFDGSGSLVYIAVPEGCEPARQPGDRADVKDRVAEKFLGGTGERKLYVISNDSGRGPVALCGYPVADGSGDTAAFVLTEVSLVSVAAGMRTFFIQYSVLMFCIVNVLAVFMTLRIRKTIVGPINSIASAAGEYMNDRKTGASGTGRFSGLGISTGDEIENLALTMADMEKELAEYVEDLTRATAEKERADTELSLATRIQADMLPNIFPAFPDRPDFDVYAMMDPAKEVGGDFYDFFLVDDDHLALVIADVSGKGVPAALFMMVSKILVQNCAMTGTGPARALEKVNSQICLNNREDMFVTVWLGILDLRDGTLTASNAGHEYPVIKRRGGDFEIFRDRHGLVIGGMDGSEYPEYSIRLEPGDMLFLYTDGVPEAMNAAGEPFGTERMLSSLGSRKKDDPTALLHGIRADVAGFTGEAPQFDDITMLCVRFIGKDAGSADEMTVEGTLENIPAVTEFVDARLEKLGCSARIQAQINIAIDELFGNIARYAYAPGTGPATVRVEVAKEPLAVIVTFTDGGVPYDPLSAAEPDVTLSADEREIGGLGVFLVKKTMDDIRYEYRDGRNILTIRKNI